MKRGGSSLRRAVGQRRRRDRGFRRPQILRWRRVTREGGEVRGECDPTLAGEEECRLLLGFCVAFVILMPRVAGPGNARFSLLMPCQLSNDILFEHGSWAMTGEAGDGHIVSTEKPL